MDTYSDAYTACNVKPWKRTKHIRDQQDDVAYWNSQTVLLNDTTKATVEEAKLNPYAGWGDWNAGGMIDILSAFCARYKIPKSARILEVGCGGGRQVMAWKAFSEQFDMNFEILAIDHAPYAIEVCRARMPDLEFRCLPAEKLPFNGRMMDVIYTYVCLQHNSAWKLERIFDAIYRSLKQAGILYMMNELTRSWHEYTKYHPEFVMAPWSSDERGSAGTAAWWIGFIADHGFELLEYYESRYVFRKISHRSIQT